MADKQDHLALDRGGFMAARTALVVATARHDDASLVALASAGTDAAELGQVLQDPAIGGFDVITLVDQPVQVMHG
jgi:hypothetical protein